MNSLLMRQRRTVHRRDHRHVVTLNLVSLTDFFTILLVFLLVHTSAPELLERTSTIVLPDSSSQQLPEQRMLVTIDRDSVTVEGRKVVDLRELAIGSEGTLPGLAQALIEEGARLGAIPEGGREVTIVGDREIPYTVLKRIMLTCQATDFAKISLAVNKLELKPSDAVLEAARMVAAVAPQGAVR